MTATQAFAEVRAVAVALAAIGGTGTAAQIAAHGNLPLRLVQQRLKSSSLTAPGFTKRAFAVVTRSTGGGSTRVPAVWGLTTWGDELAKGEGL